MKLTTLLELGLLGVLAKCAASSPLASNNTAPVCSVAPRTLALSSPPFDNYFYSDCNVAAQVVVTSPLPDSDLTLISPRLIVAWPAGNSGICTFFRPQNGINGTLSIDVVNSTVGQPLAPVFSAPAQGGASNNPSVGVKGVMHLNSSAVLTVPILGSIRTIRDFTEGPSLLHPLIQKANRFIAHSDGSASISRLWLDNVTTSSIRFSPMSNAANVSVVNQQLKFEAGDYLFSAKMDFPQMTQLKPSQALNSQSQDLITQSSTETTALSFFSYTEKLLAGGWRFLTYFGRDTMIAALLFDPILSYGNGSAMEAGIGSVLERINRTDGEVCHEETIGDYATFTNLQEGVNSNVMGCTYQMVDTSFYLPVLMDRYFLQNPIGRKRTQDFFNTPAGSIDPRNKNLTWGQLAVDNAEHIMNSAAPFAHHPVRKNLIHLKPDQPVGTWRDSEFGIGGGRIPFDVNTGLAPAALRSIAALARAGVYPNHSDWGTLADVYAQVFEDKTLKFFEVTVPHKTAVQRVNSYVQTINFTGPSEANTIQGDVSFHAIALDSPNNGQFLPKVEVMHTDTCFRLFLLNTTNQAQLTSFVNQTATNIWHTFPAGLMTDAGMLIANPALGDNPMLARNYTNGAYQGTVIWSWQMSMMAKGLENQLGRCQAGGDMPQFCNDAVVFGNVKKAYNVLWDNIDANKDQLDQEVWSWVFRNGKFEATPLGTLPPPPGVASQTESDIIQLWSLTFLAVTRNKAFQ